MQKFCVSNLFFFKSYGRKTSEVVRSTPPLGKCMVKIFLGEGVADGEGEGGSSERCLKWGCGGH